MRYEQVIGDVHENEKELSSCEDCALFDVCCSRDFDILLRARTKVIVGVVGADGGERGRLGKTGCCPSLLFWHWGSGGPAVDCGWCCRGVHVRGRGIRRGGRRGRG